MRQMKLKETVRLRPISDEQLAAPSFHVALRKMVDGSGRQPKSLADDTGIDEAQISKMLSGQAGIIWPKLDALMDECESELPIFWMLHQRGYDVSGIKKRQTELERQLEAERAKNFQLETKLETLVEFFAKTKAA